MLFKDLSEIKIIMIADLIRHFLYGKPFLQKQLFCIPNPFSSHIIRKRSPRFPLDQSA